MEKEFVPYTESLALKELGFDEPCLGFYLHSNQHFGYNSKPFATNDSFTLDAPTFSQAFRWFRQKYDLFISISHYENGYSINDLRRFETYEEAELECLKKLIEIVKQKQ
jgi:hypothetical protein